VRLEEAQRFWSPETLYLNTASYGLPPTPAWDALQAVLEDWRGGRTSWEHWGDATERARDLFARLVGVPTEWVAAGANTSAFVGLAAAALRDGARVVSAEPEFTSLLWPFLVQGRDIEVTCVPVDQVAGAVDERTDVVAVSAVQSSTGEVADLDSVIEAPARTTPGSSSTPRRRAAGSPSTPAGWTCSRAARTSGSARRAARRSPASGRSCRNS